MNKFASKFVEHTLPILNDIMASGLKVYIRSTRKFEDGVVPDSIWVPGLDGELEHNLCESLSLYDSDDHETVQTVLFTNDTVKTGGWVSL